MDFKTITTVLSLVAATTPTVAAFQLDTRGIGLQDHEFRPGRKVTGTDRAVIEAVLTDLIAFEDFRGTHPCKPTRQTQIVLHSSTMVNQGLLSDAQLAGETRYYHFEIPQELRARLRERNDESTSLSSFSPKNTNIVVRDLSGVVDQIDQLKFLKKHPEVKGFARISLPAYSSKGDLAVFRCFVGPSVHGAAATYVLKKRDGRWQIESRCVVYYF